MNHEQNLLLNMKEKEILEKAMHEFTAITGAGIKLLNDNRLIKKDGHNADALVELRQGTNKTLFWVETKNEIREQNLPAILNLMGKNAAEWLLICQYIPKPLKQKLKNQGINYLETAGNCFIRKDGLFFYINDKAVTAHRQPAQGKLWNQAGLKFLFGILINPKLLNTNYRQMAQETKVALGNIGAFIGELKQEGFLKDGVKNNKPYLFIENGEQLQRKWIELFNAVLKPKLKQGRFRFLNKEDVQNWQEAFVTKPHQFYWGAEPAGAILTKFLQPEIFTIYTNENKTAIMKQLRLVPDAEGNVELIHVFWETANAGLLAGKYKTVPPLLAYAELMTSLDSRNRETAERIKQKYLA